MPQTRYYIANMDCPTEEQIIRNGLKGMQGVEQLDFDLMARVLTVAHTLEEAAPIQRKLQSLAMEAQELAPDEQPPVAGEGRPHDHDHPQPRDRQEWIRLGLSGVLALKAEVVAWILGQERAPLVIGLALLSLALGGYTTFRKGWTALRTFTLNINFLMMIAIVGAVVIGQWPEAAMVSFLFAVAEKIEGYSLERARNAIRSLMALAPETATIQTAGGEWQVVPAEEVQTGQCVRVRPGERIPLDGVLIEGQSAVNQAPITGESLPVEKQVGDTVFAGSIAERGTFVLEVTGKRGHTTLDRILRTVQEAQAERAPTQRFVDSFARYYTPLIVGLALLVAVLPPLLFHAPFLPWLYKALVLLVIACPCALVISTPVTIVSGLAAAARHGILIKGGAALERGHRLKALALDKTGTLTQGHPVVTDIIPLNNLSSGDLLHLAASLNAHSEHPIAAAIVAHCAGSHGEQPCIPLSVTGFSALMGRGVVGEVAGQRHYLGNHRLTEENHVCGPHVEVHLNRLEREGKTAVVLTSESESLAVLGVADTLRETSPQAVRELHALGLHTVLLTGDNATTAQAIAAQVGISDVRSDLLPEDKLRMIERLRQEYGVVGMVGDGINDAPALAKSNLGFAMGGTGTDTALETADVALMQDDLRKLPEFVRLSRQTYRTLQQNIALALGIKAVFFALALLGKATLWMAVFADMGASLLVVFNGLRLLHFQSRG